MQTPVEIAFRHYQPSDDVRTEIAAQARRLEQLNARITSCRVVITGPQNRRRNGDVFDVELRIALPSHKDIIVDRCRDEAPSARMRSWRSVRLSGRPGDRSRTRAVKYTILSSCMLR